MADSKISELTAASTIATTDIIPIVQDMGTTPITKSSTWLLIRSTILSYIQASLLSGLFEKTAPVAADQLVLFDSEDTGTPKYISYSNLVPVTARSLDIIIGDGVQVISTGVKGFVEIPYDCEITSARLVADASGSIVVDIWNDTYANFPPTDADSITAAAPPTLATAQKAEDTTLTDWIVALSAGDWLAFNVDSATTVKQVTLSLTLVRL